MTFYDKVFHMNLYKGMQYFSLTTIIFKQLWTCWDIYRTWPFAMIVFGLRYTTSDHYSSTKDYEHSSKKKFFQVLYIWSFANFCVYLKSGYWIMILLVIVNGGSKKESKKSKCKRWWQVEGKTVKLYGFGGCLYEFFIQSLQFES